MSLSSWLPWALLWREPWRLPAWCVIISLFYRLFVTRILAYLLSPRLAESNTEWSVFHCLTVSSELFEAVQCFTLIVIVCSTELCVLLCFCVSTPPFLTVFSTAGLTLSLHLSICASTRDAVCTVHTWQIFFNWLMLLCVCLLNYWLGLWLKAKKVKPSGTNRQLRQNVFLDAMLSKEVKMQHRWS